MGLNVSSHAIETHEFQSCHCCWSISTFDSISDLYSILRQPSVFNIEFPIGFSGGIGMSSYKHYGSLRNFKKKPTSELLVSCKDLPMEAIHVHTAGLDWISSSLGHSFSFYANP